MKNGPYELVIAPPNYPGKRYRGRYCYEHHLVWWEHTGELPKVGEEIHHKNEKHRDNRFSNLEKLVGIDHRKHHGAKKHKECAHTIICPWCRKQFKVYGHDYKKRVKQSKSGNLFCSRSCQATWQRRH